MKGEIGMDDLKEIKQLMCDEAREKIEGLEGLELGSDRYKSGVESVTKMVDSISVLSDKEHSEELEKEEKRNKSIDRIIDRTTKIISTIASIAIPVGMALISINFEKTGTITTEAGRTYIRKCLNFFK